VPVVGDQIEVAGTKVDQPTRSGVVTDVEGRMITVQWSTGEQSVFVPAPGTVAVVGRAGARASRSARGTVAARPAKKKPATKKKAARKAPARKAPARKAPARKAPARKPATKRATKATPRKAPARKPAKKRAAKATPRKRVR